MMSREAKLKLLSFLSGAKQHSDAQQTLDMLFSELAITETDIIKLGEVSDTFGVDTDA